MVVTRPCLDRRHLRILQRTVEVGLRHRELDLRATWAIIRVRVAEMHETRSVDACSAEHQRREAAGRKTGRADPLEIEVRAQDVVPSDGFERTLQVLRPLPPQHRTRHRHFVDAVVARVIYGDRKSVV